MEGSRFDWRSCWACCPSSAPFFLWTCTNRPSRRSAQILAGRGSASSIQMTLTTFVLGFGGAQMFYVPVADRVTAQCRWPVPVVDDAGRMQIVLSPVQWSAP